MRRFVLQWKHINTRFNKIFFFSQIENLTCPLMCIVGEDDLSTSSTENTNLVVCSCLMAFFAFKYSHFSVYWAIKCFWSPDWGEIDGCREIPSPHPIVLSRCWTSDWTTIHSTLKNVPVERETQKTWAPPGPAGSNSTPLVFPFLTRHYVQLWNVIITLISPAVITLWGGHLAPHAAAQEDSWRKILNFMERHLRRWLAKNMPAKLWCVWMLHIAKGVLRA